MERFTFVERVWFNYPADHKQELITYWDNNVGAPISLDESYVEQNESFHHPYTGEEIFFNQHKEF